ncbi:hypothetical protein LTS08_006293 [Lithohypha guttulata]|uniref:Uncharacterized protein n=1 Tax=Lithohypha guttulata TaxID=1690604 RepID=A0AAN7Y546_9EURO|nr:hypothetical protein LTR51_002711 [Lithohypha guttulata]KAK5082894.1 hypothetical protein LTR05_006775 [Lithohypha guttulata]KAK5098914.1 hypothetical protein LTS08_006293 [Lithohypha guttulata]
MPGSPARMSPLPSTFTTLTKPPDTTIEDTPAHTESHNCNGYTDLEHPLVGRPGYPCNETEPMHLPGTTAEPHVPGRFSPHPSPTDSTSINPATVQDKRQCDPNNNGCSTCSECCVFKLSIFDCDTAIFHSQLVVKADTQCRDITTIFGNDPAIMISECTGWFDTCYIYWRAGCRQEDLGTAKTIKNVAGQCISFGQFPFGSIKCFGEGSGGP